MAADLQLPAAGTHRPSLPEPRSAKAGSSPQARPPDNFPIHPLPPLTWWARASTSLMAAALGPALKFQPAGLASGEEGEAMSDTSPHPWLQTVQMRCI